MSAESSPASVETTPAAGADQTAQVSDVSNSTVSSSGEGAKAEGSIVDAVKAALAPKSEAEGSPASQGQDSTTGSVEQSKDGKDPAASEELTEEEAKSLKPKTRQRIEHFRTENKGLKGQVETLTPKAAEFDKIVNFISANRLTTEDINSAFDIVAAIRNDPVKAYDRLIPIMNQLATMVGEVLPADLQERVRLGYISDQDARELNRSRNREKLANQRSAETEQRTAEQREIERRQGIVGNVSSAMSDWETSKKSSDPDYHLKADRIGELVKLDVFENGYPETKADAIKRVDAIYDRVTKEIRKFVPKPQEKRVVAGGGASTETVAEPKNLLEAIRAGMRKSA